MDFKSDLKQRIEYCENVLEKFKFVSEDQPGLIMEIEKMMKKGR